MAKRCDKRTQNLPTDTTKAVMNNNFVEKTFSPTVANLNKKHGVSITFVRKVN